jgi:microcystin-dependent protein
MSYTAWSVIFGEQPSATKWNILGGNDASFRDGTGIANGAININHVDSTVLFPGFITPYGGAGAPSGWFLCDGSAKSRATYSALFAVLGTLYGTGDGSTTFNIPNLQGRVPFGKNGATFSALGLTGGAESVNLSHSHTVNSHSHGGNTYATGINNSNHTHSSIVRGSQASDGQSADHTHNYTVTDGASAPGTSASLSTQSLLDPYQVVNYLVKY